MFSNFFLMKHMVSVSSKKFSERMACGRRLVQTVRPFGRRADRKEKETQAVYTKIWKKSRRDSKASKIMSSRNQLRADRNQLIRMQH